MAIRRAPGSSGLLVAAGVLMWLASTSAAAQTVGGTFVGRVRDQGAGTLPNASVSITNTATGVVTSVVTNEDGFYSAPNLLPGTYDVVMLTGQVESRLPHPMPISMMFWSAPGSDPAVIKAASAYEAATHHRVPPPAFGPLSARARGTK